MHPKGVNGIGCIIYIPFYPHVPYGIACIIYPIVFSCILWYCMYYTSHCILMYHMVLHVLYIPLYPDVPYGIACTMCRGGIVFHDFGAAHDVCLDPLVRSPGCFHVWTNWNISKRIYLQTRILRHKLSLSTMQLWWQNWYLRFKIWGLRWSRNGWMKNDRVGVIPTDCFRNF